MASPPEWINSSVARRVIDGGLVAGSFGVGLGGHIAARSDASVEAAPLSFGIGLAAFIAAGVLIGRRRAPMASLAVLIGVTIVANAFVDPALFSAQLGLEVLVIFFAAGAWSERLGLAASVAAVTAGLLVLGAVADDSEVLPAIAFAVALVAFPMLAGYAARIRRSYVEAVEARLEVAERDRDARARTAITTERQRIARELHDVVAHHVSLIGVQAAAARSSLANDSAATRAALVAIESSSRMAVGEMRLLLDALQPLDGDGDAGRANLRAHEPQRGIDQLGALAEQWRGAGFAIDIDVIVPADSLTPAESACAYRIVEEALTNVARHSLARSAVITVECDLARVRVAIADPGPVRLDSSHVTEAGGGRVGRGHFGMRQRVELLGGTVLCAPTSEGGFLVEAQWPSAGGQP